MFVLETANGVSVTNPCESGQTAQLAVEHTSLKSEILMSTRTMLRLLSVMFSDRTAFFLSASAVFTIFTFIESGALSESSSSLLAAFLLSSEEDLLETDEELMTLSNCEQASFEDNGPCEQATRLKANMQDGTKMMDLLNMFPLKVLSDRPILSEYPETYALPA